MEKKLEVNGDDTSTSSVEDESVADPQAHEKEPAHNTQPAWCKGVKAITAKTASIASPSLIPGQSQTTDVFTLLKSTSRPAMPIGRPHAKSSSSNTIARSAGSPQSDSGHNHPEAHQTTERDENHIPADKIAAASATCEQIPIARRHLWIESKYSAGVMGNDQLRARAIEEETDVKITFSNSADLRSVQCEIRGALAAVQAVRKRIRSAVMRLRRRDVQHVKNSPQGLAYDDTEHLSPNVMKQCWPTKTTRQALDIVIQSSTQALPMMLQAPQSIRNLLCLQP